MSKNLLYLIFILLTIPPLYGQQASEQALDTVEIIRIPLQASQTGRNISIIRAEDLATAPFTSLDDLLQFLPGVEVQSRNAFGVQGDITMRGATFTQVLLLIDGMRVNDPLTGHFNSYLPVTPDEIQRIEVLRGSAAAMYGADAVGGVINIITKVFASSTPDQNEYSSSIQFGRDGLISSRNGFFRKEGKLSLGGGFFMNQAEGELISERRVGNETLEAFENFFDIKTGGLSLGYDFSDSWSLKARTAFDHRDFSARYFYTASPLDKSVETTRNWWNQLQLNHLSEKSRTTIQLAYKHNTDEFVFSPDFPSTNFHTTKRGLLQVDHLRPISNEFTVNSGIQVDQRSIESNDRGDHEDWHVGAYVMGAYQPKNLSLTGSLRLDYDENFDWEFSPMFTLAYTTSQITLRSSIGRNIRAADYTERYVSTNLLNLSPGRNLGNPDLRAEQGWSQEIGADIWLSDKWSVKATAFFRQSSNLIDYVLTNENQIRGVGNLRDSADYLFAQNITDVDTRGFEVESWYTHVGANGDRFLWSLGYTQLNTTNEEEVISVYISSHARHLLTSQLLFQSKKWEVGVNGLYKVRDGRSAEAINANLEDSYSVWNLRSSGYILDQVGLSFQIHNLFDATYQDILGAPMPGRWFMGGVVFRWGKR